MEVAPEVIEMSKEERLERVKCKQRQFQTRRTVKNVLEDVLGMVIIYRVEENMKKLVEEVIVSSLEEVTIKRMVVELQIERPMMKNKLESRLKNMRLEEDGAMRLMILEEEREERLETVLMNKKA